MIPSVRFGAHEIENLTNEHYRKAKIKRLNQVSLFTNSTWNSTTLCTFRLHLLHLVSFGFRL